MGACARRAASSRLRRQQKPIVDVDERWRWWRVRTRASPTGDAVGNPCPRTGTFRHQPGNRAHQPIQQRRRVISLHLESIQDSGLIPSTKSDAYGRRPLRIARNFTADRARNVSTSIGLSQERGGAPYSQMRLRFTVELHARCRGVVNRGVPRRHRYSLAWFGPAGAPGGTAADGAGGDGSRMLGPPKD